MNFDVLKLGFANYLENISEISNKTYENLDSDISIFMYSTEFKNYISDELDVDPKILSMSINDILKLWEKERTGATEFKSFFQWKLEGYSVKKGEKAFVLWGRKRKATAKQEVDGKDDPQEEEYKFYPLAYVFSDAQIERTEDRENRKEKEKALIIDMNIEGEAN